MKLGIQAAVCGVVYSLSIGFFTWPSGIGAAAVLIAAQLWLVAEIGRQRTALPWWLKFLVVSAAVNSAALMVTTNHLIIVLSRAHILTVLLLLMAARAAGAASPPLATSFILVLGDFLRAALRHWLRPISPRSLNRGMVGGRAATPSSARRAVWRGMLWGLLPLILFHLLFAEVNGHYAAFVAIVIDYIFAWEFWRLVLQSGLQSWLLYGLLRVKLTQKNEVDRPRMREWCYALLPCIGLFALFSGFQSEYLRMNASLAAFKNLSLYVQRGFWELVAVALLGYLFWAAVARRGENLGKIFTTRRLLAAFALELSLIAVFVIHKVVLHQAIFGLKDTRIAATLGGIVALATFVLCVLQAFSCLKLTAIFPVQLVLTSLFIAIMSVVNVDRLVTVAYPIRYRVNDNYHPDLAYLLMNSFDNYKEWGGLMMTAMERGVPAPEEYYWGRYTPLCLNRAQGHLRVNYFADHLRTLRVEPQGGIEGLRQALRFNLRLNEARGWVEGNRKLIEAFNRFIEERCASA